jgi:hypothetical protein
MRTELRETKIVSPKNTQQIGRPLVVAIDPGEHDHGLNILSEVLQIWSRERGSSIVPVSVVSEVDLQAPEASMSLNEKIMFLADQQLRPVVKACFGGKSREPRVLVSKLCYRLRRRRRRSSWRFVRTVAKDLLVLR